MKLKHCPDSKLGIENQLGILSKSEFLKVVQACQANLNISEVQILPKTLTFPCAEL